MTGSGTRVVRRLGLFLGPALAMLIFVTLPDSFATASGESVPFTTAGRATLAAMGWMGVWWLTEAIDISATALLPLALFPIAGIASIKATASPYASDIIFLFMGGFLLALSMQRWGLDKRVALITLRIVGTKPVNMVGGFMVATAMMSAFVSNTATTAMMLPIAMSVIALIEARQEGTAANQPRTDSNLAVCLMLGIAYAASIGGVTTLIGTPPNAFLKGFIQNTIDAQYRTEIGFGHWMLIGVPLAAVFLPITWLLLTRLIYPIRMKKIEGGRAMLNEQYRALGRMSRGEWVTFIVFILTAIAWMIRPVLTKGIPAEVDSVTGEVINFFIPPLVPGLSDAGIAMTAGLVLFLIPAKWSEHEFVMNWATARKLPWGILILFGGGLSLAAAVKANGVADFIGAQAIIFHDWNTLVLVVIVITGVIFLTELTSNTATTATLVPILAALAIGLEIHPFLLIVPAALAASCAFMMPVATPPNAIVFGSGRVTIPQMCKAGLWLNLIGIVLITLLAYTIMLSVLA